MEYGIQLKDSGIPLTIEIQNPNFNDKFWNTVPGIRNPLRGIQNPKLSWIPIHGAKSKVKVYLLGIGETPGNLSRLKLALLFF